MTIDDQIREKKKLEYNIDREAPKYGLYHQTKSVNMNILQEKK